MAKKGEIEKKRGNFDAKLERKRFKKMKKSWGNVNRKILKYRNSQEKMSIWWGGLVTNFLGKTATDQEYQVLKFQQKKN